MKKCILGIILFLFVCGCSNKVEDINTLIENTDNTVIGINYPITNTKLDDIIKNDIDKIYNSFKEDNFSYSNAWSIKFCIQFDVWNSKKSNSQ